MLLNSQCRRGTLIDDGGWKTRLSAKTRMHGTKRLELIHLQNADSISWPWLPSARRDSSQEAYFVGHTPLQRAPTNLFPQSPGENSCRNLVTKLSPIRQTQHGACLELFDGSTRMPRGMLPKYRRATETNCDAGFSRIPLRLGVFPQQTS